MIEIGLGEMILFGIYFGYVFVVEVLVRRKK